MSGPTLLAPERVRALLADGGRTLAESGKQKAMSVAGLPEWFAARTPGPPEQYVLTPVVRITPQLAEELLARNTFNRKPSQRKIRRYAAMMRDGEWQLNGEPLKFSAAGRLLDGQSRLQAVALRRGAPIPPLAGVPKLEGGRP